MTTPTAVNWSTPSVALGPGKLWGNLSVPGVNGKLILHTDGSPDATSNPDAIHIGMTEAGSAFSIKQTFQDFFADEFQDPIIKHITAQEAAITGNWLQVLDMELVALLTPGTIRSDGAGYNKVTFGGNRTLTYSSVALIFPLEEDPTLFGVFHLYKAINEPGLAVEIGAKKLGTNPFAFKGIAITSRAAGDQTGAYWKQLSVGS
jgi:hypothetical protein